MGRLSGSACKLRRVGGICVFGPWRWVFDGGRKMDVRSESPGIVEEEMTELNTWV